MLDCLPNLHVTGAGSGGQFFPRWTHEKAGSADRELDFASTNDTEVDEFGYRRLDNITDKILTLYRDTIGGQVTKDAIFYYVYGLLHDSEYREKYAADLRKMLPRIPTPTARERFDQLADAGHKLADLHVNYDTVEPYPLDVQLKAGVDPGNRETCRVDKMKWRSKNDHSAIVYNSKATIAGIPNDAERYMLGSRSALQWIIERYQVHTDKASGIVNDPNDWCDEHDNPTYIVDLVKKITAVSVETMKIVDGLAGDTGRAENRRLG
jgi:predicted helicase